MANVEVSRTLVKSPPEVWAELGRDGRLAELIGDESLQVTVAEELAVLEWQAASSSGRIEIHASGWGTKVSLVADVAEEPARAEPTPRRSEAQSTVSKPKPEAKSEQSDLVVEEIASQATTVARVGLWTRIKHAFTGDDPAAAVADAAITESETLDEDEAQAEADNGQVDCATAPEVPEAELDPSPEYDAGQPTYEKRLTAVLDHLGSAHKRPFSSM